MKFALNKEINLCMSKRRRQREEVETDCQIDRRAGRLAHRQTETDKQTARGEELVNTHNKEHYCQRK